MTAPPVVPRSSRRRSELPACRPPFASRAAAIAVLLGVAASAACAAPRNPAAGGPRFPPFERLPYLQAVDTASAEVRWRLDRPVTDSLRYRLAGGGGWTGAAVGSPSAAGDATTTPGAYRAADRVARLGGLPPDTAVDYVVVAGDTSVGPHRFRTAPRASGSRTVHVLAFGDSGWGSKAQLRLAGLMDRQPWDLVVHTGDVAYDDGTELDLTRRHFFVYRDLLSRAPFFPTPGDHDLRTEGGAPYDRAFAWPKDSDGARYYAFRWGPVQFVALVTTDEAPDGWSLRQGEGRQLAWLVDVLEGTRRDPTVLWTIVFTHAPAYSSGGGPAGHGSDPDLQEVLAPLFERYGVDLVLAGHDHHYERTRPLRSGEAVAPGCGPVYVVTGGGGASRFLRYVAPSSWTAAVSLEHHFVSLSVTPSRMTGEVVAVDGRIVDEFRVWPHAGGDGLASRCR